MCSLSVWAWSIYRTELAQEQKLLLDLRSFVERSNALSGSFDNAGAIRIANILRHLGEKKAFKILRKYNCEYPARVAQARNGLELLVPLAFQTENSRPFNLAGGPILVFCNDIPFNTTFVFAINGELPDYETYLTQAETNGTFISQKLHPRLPISAGRDAENLAMNSESAEFVRQQSRRLIENVITLNSADESKLYWDSSLNRFGKSLVPCKRL